MIIHKMKKNLIIKFYLHFVRIMENFNQGLVSLHFGP